MSGFKPRFRYTAGDQNRPQVTLEDTKEQFMPSFFSQVEENSHKNHSLLCVGLDTDPSRIPQILQNDPDPIFSFNREIIDATSDLVCCYKPQIAYYGAAASEDSLVKTIRYAQDKGIAVLLDSKRGDIGSTAEMYAKEAFERFGADAVTINPYLGFDAMEPFLDYEDKGIFILCRNSNPGAADLQDLRLEQGGRLFERVAELAATEWNKNSNVALVVGATRPAEISDIRKIVGNMTLLLVGVGAQGADVEAMMANAKGGGTIINSARAILYASNQSDFALRARGVAEQTRAAINKFR